MAANLGPHPQPGRPPLIHPPGVDTVHRLFRQRPRTAGGRANRGALPPSRRPAASR
jgi:hypothetical protein